MNNFELEVLLNTFLKPQEIKDYCLNGMQLEGKTTVQKIVTGVTACQALIEVAIEDKADAILVHHGYFWRGKFEALKGMKYRRIKALIENNINLYAYHLPLDIHPEIGNNVQLARRLGIKLMGGLEDGNANSLAVWGELPRAMPPNAFSMHIDHCLSRSPLHIVNDSVSSIKRVGLCTGKGQDYIDLAANKLLDAFISGEVSEYTTFSAREQGIHYFGAGHHATERYGVKALGEWLADNYGFNVSFIDIDNPV
ncbi:Nif3-like dinuclear metal center hexameric protein [Candidatus Enterovibrio escicola]|uniref:Nif3-like dinuclear metal center hexameric protein n=1 Tax=Candidatus Enterovibrio escicola TaxID=1927127 RepID=UPI00123833DD|nr:Nif3-like dinuclear metal center hexameric protein [Candidatus Enterovibrio escacola]